MAVAVEAWLGLISFILPGIIKALVVRNRHLLMDAQAYVRSYIFENSLDPLGLYRAFREPRDMRSPAHHERSPPRRLLVLSVMLAAFITQGALVGLQFLSGDKVVEVRGTRGLGVEMDRNATFNLNRPSCESQATGDGAAISVTSCRDTFFQISRQPNLRGDRYLFKVLTTYGKRNETHPFIYSLTLSSEVFIRTVQLTNRLVSENGEWYVSTKSTREGVKNLIRRAADKYLFSDCIWNEWLSSRVTQFQPQDYVTIQCPNPGFEMGNNAATSSKFNRFAAAFSSSFRIGGMEGTYLKPASDSGIATSQLVVEEITWRAYRANIVPLWVVILIAAGCVIVKLVIDLGLGEDNDYKAAILVNEVAGNSSSESFTNIRGTLQFKWSRSSLGTVHRGYVHQENVTEYDLINRDEITDTDIIR